MNNNSDRLNEFIKLLQVFESVVFTSGVERIISPDYTRTKEYKKELRQKLIDMYSELIDNQ